MYAVIESGGKQYRVAVGDRVRVESLDAEPGATIELARVLLVANGEDSKIGTPHVDTTVQATVLGHGRGKKVRIFKLRRRLNSRTRGGHRQAYTELEITAIGGVAKPKPLPQKKRAVIEETAAEPAAAEADDLTQINGIGPVIVEKLNGLGISTFRQLAELTDADIERIDTELNFKGRIQRDDWVGQAKRLVGV